MLNNSQRKTLEQTWELDCAYGLKGVALPREPVVLETSARPRGLVLVTGPTGSGKTTTLAALLDHINHTRSEHILTIEDPIEFVYGSTKSFANALRAWGDAGSGDHSTGGECRRNRTSRLRPAPPPRPWTAWSTSSHRNNRRRSVCSSRAVWSLCFPRPFAGVRTRQKDSSVG